MKVSKLKRNPNNPREIKDEKFDKLKRSISEFPQMMSLRPIIIDADNVVLGGNMRLAAIKDLGMKDIPDEWVKRADELTDEQKKEFIIKDNVGFGAWNWDTLANEWDEAKLIDWGLDIPGFEVVEDVPQEDEAAAAEAINKAAELQKKWGTATGQLWQLGSHRLLCGDSCSPQAVQRVLDGETPNLMVTDPPYGVDYHPEWRDEAAEKGLIGYAASSVAPVHNDDRIDWSAAFQLFLGNVFYCWHAGRHASEVQASIEMAGFEIRSQIVWAKPNFAISRGHYNWQHEPCWYAVRKGENASWIGDHSQTTLWEINRNTAADGGHSTQKPIECMSKAIRNHEGDVYDPFLGSGTTLIACEQLNRKCYAIEIAPEYVAVALERWHNLTNQTPELIEQAEAAKT